MANRARLFSNQDLREQGSFYDKAVFTGTLERTRFCFIARLERTRLFSQERLREQDSVS